MVVLSTGGNFENSAAVRLVDRREKQTPGRKWGQGGGTFWVFIVR